MNKLPKLLLVILCFGMGCVHGVWVEQVKADQVNTYGDASFYSTRTPTDPTDPYEPVPPDVFPEPVEPINPINPDIPNKGQDGPLSLDFVPTLFFGKQKISDKEQTYAATAQKLSLKYKQEEVFYGPHYVQVTDRRSVQEGWTVTVKQLTNFTSKNSAKHELLGTEIRMSLPSVNAIKSTESKDAAHVFNNLLIIKPNQTAHVMTAKSGFGKGSWQSIYGNGYYEVVSETTTELENSEQLTSEDTVQYEGVTKNRQGEVVQERWINQAVTLTIPGKQSIEPAFYQTVLQWDLANVPTNVNN